jgi:hypothetical protein
MRSGRSISIFAVHTEFAAALFVSPGITPRAAGLNRVPGGAGTADDHEQEHEHDYDEAIAAGQS